MTLQPSYQQGFSPRDYEPLYPQLWSGCVGAWAPCLGPTGTVLRDHSGYSNYGTLTNFALSGTTSNWVPSGGKIALDFDGSNDYVDCGNSQVLTPIQFAYSIWVKPTSFIYSYNCAISWDANFSSTVVSTLLVKNTGKLACYVARSGGYTFYDATGVSTLTTGNWYHLVMMHSNSGLVAYVNGIIDGSAAYSGNPTIGTATTYIGGQLGYILSNPRLWCGQLDDIRIYNRALSYQEIRLLASERGIAYKRRSKKVFRVSAATTNAAWLSNRNVLITPGIK